MKYVVVALWLILLMAGGCQFRQRPLFEQLSPEETAITFNNRIEENDSVNIVDFFYIYNGGGVGVGDLNNDGLADIYFTGNQVSSKLYLNKGNFRFEDITRTAGVGTRQWARGVSMVDINNDGLLDLYVSISGDNRSQPEDKRNLLFVNQGVSAQGVPTFRELAAEYGLADTGHSTQAAFFDYDLDGDLDAYLLTNGMEKFNHNTLRPKKKNGEGISTDRLYRNEGIGPQGHPVYKDVSREAGITIEGYGLGIAITDINRDGWPDVYCANDFVTNDLLWINNGNGTFTDRAAEYLRHTSFNGMGVDIADFNNDGLVDIVELDMLPEGNKRQKTMLPAPNPDRFEQQLLLNYYPQYVRNTLQLNNGLRTPITRPGSQEADTSVIPFSEIGHLAGVHATDWSWSALLADYDNDGYRDLFITNGYPKDIIDLDYIMYRSTQTQFGTEAAIMKKLRAAANELPTIKVHNYLYRNNGDLTFGDKSSDWGFERPTDSNGAAYADLDNDGDLDLVVNNINDPAGIYRNDAIRTGGKGQMPDHHYLRLQFKGSPQNRMGLGTRVELRYGGKIQFYEHSTVRGFESSVEQAGHFGLGATSVIDSLLVTWPDGRFQLLRHVKADQTLTLNYWQAGERPPLAPAVPTPLFREVSQRCSLDFWHRENDFVDFKIQPLLPHQYSRNGPGIAVGDVDGDGLDDCYVGGASGQAGRLFRQDKTGRFRSQTIDPDNKPEEDMGALFFDADGDGDQDLYVASGGNEFAAGSTSYQDRLYRNDGQGNLSRDITALPATTASGSCVTGADYDHDGDIDLFVGGRVTPGKYPLPAQSYLLQNNGGQFRDVTPQIAKELAQAGMISAALWSDFNNDGWVDLVLAGEWMPISFYQNQRGKFVHVAAKTGLENHTGWWNSLAAGDFDNDGDVDYVAGNLGLNSKFTASAEEPMTIYANDFDHNGSTDPVLCYYLPGEDGRRHLFPNSPRDAMTDQMVSMRKRFPRYANYAVAQPGEFLPEKELQSAYVARCTYLASACIENLGGGKFRIRPLPQLAQIAPLYGITVGEYTGDGLLDILTTGNSYTPEVLAGRNDASVGLLLQGDGKGNFKPVSPTRSGFVVEGDVKSTAQLSLAGNRSLYLIGQNNGPLRAFEKANPPTSAIVIRLQPTDAYGVVTLSDGRKLRQEFYYGSTYLSQSSRTWLLPEHCREAVVYSYRGSVHRVFPNENQPVSRR